ncbi:hypothetical protein ACPOL_1998 [Acidisarcina polymorpha]|uniref:Uncharacterized protein n=1 Tax=Acidisarcina polymorpha TaxID=2211140 RepID=A0A2Z5FXU0_9BACT|nr:hypothetical protein ACPOL_1998 [Acidisarcina polymorpha]
MAFFQLVLLSITGHLQPLKFRYRPNADYLIVDSRFYGSPEEG